MALYKTHTRFNIFIVLPVIIIFMYCFFSFKTPFLITFLSCFVYSTLFMGPDMDISDKIKLFSLKGVLTLPFRLYSKLFSHRGISHSILFGTTSRILFLLIFFGSILWIVDNSLLSTSSFLFFIKRYKPYILFGMSGIFLSDLSHLVLDFK